MKNLVLLAGMLATVLAVATPALAQQVPNESEGSNAGSPCFSVIVDESGNKRYFDVGGREISREIVESGSFGCVAGSSGSDQDVVPAPPGGPSAGPPSGAKVAPVAPPPGADSPVFQPKEPDVARVTPEITGSSGPVIAVGPVVEQKQGGGGQPQSGGTKTELPRTGGVPLLALGTGALLVAGGLLARRIIHSRAS